MPHIFLNCPHFNGDNRFQTHSAILDEIPYKPQVLIIGTYNDGNNVGNNADFFYGRNYFWPVISNLCGNANILTQRRDAAGLPPGNPTLGQILNLSSNFRLTFADLITDVIIDLPNHNDNHLNTALGNDNAISNHQAIIEYINGTPSITHVYCTTKLNNQPHLNHRWELIVNHVNLVNPDVSFGKILTPSGMGGIPNFEGLNRAATIARYWVWVNHNENPHGAFVHQDGYTQLNHTWLTNCLVNVELF
jgi:hypothetical protein